MANVEVLDRPPTVTVNAGDSITIHLVENAGTGYRWSVALTGDAVSLQSSERIAAAPRRPGAVSDLVIVLRADEPGTAEAEFRLARSWEPAAPVDVWQLEVCVTS